MYLFLHGRKAVNRRDHSFSPVRPSVGPFFISVNLRAAESKFRHSLTYGSFHFPARNIFPLLEKGANPFFLLLRGKPFCLVAFLAALAHFFARYDKLLPFNKPEPRPVKSSNIHFVRQRE